jgi:flagellar biosynthesis/type III secretory pathway protein FliH
MTSRLIKQGTKRALNIQYFLFKEDFTECAPSVEMEQIDGTPNNPAAPPDIDPIEETTVTPGIDTESLEMEAYQRGFQQGEIAGRETAEQAVETVMRQYADSIQEISKIKSRLYIQAEKEVVRLAVEVARKIVDREIHADRNIIQTLVRVALSRVTENTSVTMRLNPLDYKFLMEQSGGIAEDGGRDVSLQSDNTIKQGGCLVETGCGDIDARIEEKFREVENAFFEDLK